MDGSLAWLAHVLWLRIFTDNAPRLAVKGTDVVSVAVYIDDFINQLECKN